MAALGKRRSFSQDTDHSCIGLGTFASGASALTHLSVVHPYKAEDLVIEGQNGAIVLRRNEVVLFDSDGIPQIREDAPFSWEVAYRYQLMSFIASIAAGQWGLDKLSLWAMSTLTAGKQSAKRGVPVRVRENDRAAGTEDTEDSRMQLQKEIA